MHFYIHIPFCRQKCPYCKFALTPIFDEFKKKRYIEYLKREIGKSLILSSRSDPFQNYLWEIKNLSLVSKGKRDSPTRGVLSTSVSLRNDKKLGTIYFGGGTPSVLSHDEVKEILECFPDYREYDEISFECNPEDITEEYVRWLIELGINRISLGIQTLNSYSLREIHRSDRESILRALESISNALFLSFRRKEVASTPLVGESASFQSRSFVPQDDKKWKEFSLNIDFILGLPHVKKGETLENIRELHTKFPYITHTSVYMLEDEKYPKHWKALSITEKEMQEEFLEIMEYFKTSWWNHYELSNFSKLWYESIHNRSYWDHSNYLGFGLSASSFEEGRRWTNSSSFRGYYAWKIEDEEILTEEQIEIERMMFGLRSGGHQLESIEKPHIRHCEVWGIQDPLCLGENDRFLKWGMIYPGSFVSLRMTDAKVQELINEGLLEVSNNRIKPTKTWIFIIDYIMGRLL